MRGGWKAFWADAAQHEGLLPVAARGFAGLLLLWLAASSLVAWRDDERLNHAAAVQREGMVRAKAEWLRKDLPSVPDVGGALTDIAAELAREAGLSLSRNEARGGDAVSVAVTGKAPAVLGWLAEWERRGYVADQLSLTPQADGTAALTMEIRRARP